MGTGCDKLKDFQRLMYIALVVGLLDILVGP